MLPLFILILNDVYSKRNYFRGVMYITFSEGIIFPLPGWSPLYTERGPIFMILSAHTT